MESVLFPNLVKHARMAVDFDLHILHPPWIHRYRHKWQRRDLAKPKPRLVIFCNLLGQALADSLQDLVVLNVISIVSLQFDGNAIE